MLLLNSPRNGRVWRKVNLVMLKAAQAADSFLQVFLKQFLVTDI